MCWQYTHGISRCGALALRQRNWCSNPTKPTSMSYICKPPRKTHLFCIPAKNVFRIQVFHLEDTLEGILAPDLNSIANAQVQTPARRSRNKPVVSHIIAHTPIFLHTTVHYASLRHENSQWSEKSPLKTGIILHGRSGCASFLHHLLPCLVQGLSDDKQGQDEDYRAQLDSNPECWCHGMDFMIATTK